MSPPLQEWHEFFSVVGTAAATLIGAMFVVVSIGSGILTRDRAAAIRAFLTATVTHLSVVLFGAMFVMVPGLGWTWLGAIVGVAGIAGVVNSVRIVSAFHQHDGTDRSDWFWYAAFPPVGYAILLASAATAFRGAALSVDLWRFRLEFCCSPVSATPGI